MNNTMSKLKDKIKLIGFDGQCIINSEDIPFDITLLKLCEMNTCGNYAKNYTCPPYVGGAAELIEKAKTYKNMFVFNKIYKIEDPFDIDGMNKGNIHFNKMMKKTAKAFKSFNKDFLLLSAGGCRLCKVCAVIKNKPCRHPKYAFASLEAYCINVASLAKVCGLNYVSGENTVTYFGGVLINSINI